MMQYEVIDKINDTSTLYELVESTSRSYVLTNKDNEKIEIIKLSGGTIGIIRETTELKIHLVLDLKRQTLVKIKSKIHSLENALPVKTEKIDNRLPEYLKLDYDLIEKDQSIQRCELVIRKV